MIERSEQRIPSSITKALPRAKTPQRSWFWDLYARWYDKISRTRAYQEMMADVVEAINLQPGQRILDVGCGTGNLHQNLKDVTRNFELVGLDFSDSMLRVAVQKNPSGDYRLRDLNEFPWPFEDASFDAIACVNNLYTLADPKRALEEMKRLLKPGGRVVIANPQPGFSPGAILLDHCRRADFAGWMEIARNTHRIAAIMGINVAIANRGKEKLYTFTTIPDLEKIVAAAGFFVTKTEQTYLNQDALLLGESWRENSGPFS